MRITRSGADRDHGTSEVRLHLVGSGVGSDGEIWLEAMYVADFNTYARHHWNLHIDPKDWQLFFDALRKAIANEKDTTLLNALSANLTSILHIATACSEYGNRKASEEAAD